MVTLSGPHADFPAVSRVLPCPVLISDIVIGIAIDIPIGLVEKAGEGVGWYGINIRNRRGQAKVPKFRGCSPKPQDHPPSVGIHCCRLVGFKTGLSMLKSASAADFSADLGLQKFGTAMAARIPIMATTISNSISVKPFFFFMEIHWK